ncbi:NADH-dependent oxidoreductase [Lactobacillus sp. ESL0681]|uniref:oxidoreductase n=1 Tax=Lactobacillus sp. ESL0681 TaxID=2983211 RepID=UPI0023F659A3|nr:NADH-dependent oxidoreductase [Lactobacillus sp. ESL0681]WEV39602.1 NADH-dependent oxidoreductase [Lactobacillus sp. ESL0681]
MNEKYSKLLTQYTFENGGTIPTHTAMSPMLTLYGEKDGTVGQTAIDYFATRSKSQGMLITGASYISDKGYYEGELGLDDDKFLPGLTKLAQTMKKDGNKAIVQLHHAGKQATGSAAKYGYVQTPSDMPATAADPTPGKGMSEAEIEQVIQEFADATKRVIKAGFDGVEIHGANWYLVHEFFSPFYNHRTDKWGGSLENRMRFPLEVLKAVKEAAKDKPGFIIGFRMTPEEDMPSQMTKDVANTSGYTVEDGLKLASAIADEGIDYVHYSLFTKYNAGPKDSNQSYGQLLKQTIGDRATTIISSGVHTADDALDALNHGDIIAIGRESIVEPNFIQKIKDGKEDQIQTAITAESAPTLNIPKVMIDVLVQENTPFLINGRENLKPLSSAEKVDTASGASAN